MSQITREERDALLDELDKEVDKWAQQELKQIDEEVALAKQFLRSMSGSDRVELHTYTQLSSSARLNVGRLFGDKTTIPTQE